MTAAESHQRRCVRCSTAQAIAGALRRAAGTVRSRAEAWPTKPDAQAAAVIIARLIELQAEENEAISARCSEDGA